MKIYFEYIYDTSLLKDNWVPYIVIDDDNIGYWMHQHIHECVLEVKEEENLFRNIVMLSSSTKIISIKLHEGFNKEIIEEQLELIIKFLKNSKIIVKELNGWNIQEKFDEFGESAVYVDPDGMVYYHPDCFYNSEKPICHISEFTEDFHYTRPHLICLNCNTFYCHRNIFLNKKYTSEYKAPCSYQCKETTLFSKYSKKLFNSIIQEDMFKPENLDKVDSFIAENEYEDFIKGNIYNYIKNTDYSGRKL